MALKHKVTADELKALPDVIKAEYAVQADGSGVLNVDGVVSKTDFDAVNTKLTEFRTTNVALLQDIDTKYKPQLAKFEGVDPEEYKTLKQNADKTGIKKPDDLAKQIADAIAAATKPLNEKLTEITTREQTLAKELDAKKVDEKLTEVGLKYGVQESAMPDFLERGRKVFRMADGEVRGFNEKGQPVFSQKRGDLPLPIEEWVEGLPKNAPHLFKPSGGGGSHNNPNPAVGSKVLVAPTAVDFGLNLEDIAKGKTTVQMPQQ